MALPSLINDIDVTISDVEILEKIGSGAQSAVYLARRISGDEKKTLAVKVCKAASKLDEKLNEYRVEASILARIDYDGIPKVFEVGTCQDSKLPYMLMEYVEGKDLSHFLEKPIDETTLIAHAIRISSALAHIHQFGLIHRDIKPENILISPTGAKILDLGLAVSAKQDTTVAQNQNAGTLQYMSPEQTGALNRTVDERSDLYSLGLVLFRCATGKPAFSLDRIGDLIHLNATKKAPLAYEVNPKVSKQLSRIIEKLLAKDPDDRYQTARGLVHDLNRVESLESKALGLGDQFGDSSYDLPLIGRQEEFKQLNNVWIQVVRKHGAITLVLGEPGEGKSRLLRELVKEAERLHTKVVRTKCSLKEQIPFAPIKEFMDVLLSRINALPDHARSEALHTIKESAKRELSALVSFSPMIPACFPEIRATQASSAENFYRDLARFLAVLCVEKNIIYVIDDIQWMDESSLKVLSYLGSAIEKMSVMIACTARSDASSHSAVERFTNSLRNFIKAQLLIKPLTSAATTELIHAHLGQTPQNQRFAIDSNALNCVVNRGGGNPFAIGEFVRTLTSSGLMWPSARRWQLDESSLDRVKLPSDVMGLLIGRIQRLNSQSTQVLTTAAILGRNFTLKVLSQLVEKAEPQTNGFLSPAIREGLIEKTGPTEYRFVHDRIQEAFLGNIDASVLKSLHQTIAETLDQNIKGAEESASAESIFALANHYKNGRWEKNPQRAYETNLKAGLVAEKKYSLADARGFLKTAEAVALQSSITPSHELYRILGTIEFIRGNLQEAESNYKRSIELTTNGVIQAQIYLSLSRICLARHDIAGMEGAAFQGLRTMGMRTPESYWDKFLCVIEFFIGKFIERTKIGYGRAKGDRAKKMSAAVDLLSQIALAGWYKQKKNEFAVVRGIYYANRLGTPKEIIGAYLIYALTLSDYDDQKGHDKNLAIASAAAKMTGSPTAIGNLMVWESIGHRKFGNYTQHFEVAKKIFENYLDYLDADLRLMLHQVVVGEKIARGLFIESLKWIKQYRQFIGEATGTEHYKLAKLYEMYALSGIGHQKESATLRTEVASWDVNKHTAGFRDTYANCNLAMNLDLGETSPEVDRYVEILRKTRPTPKQVPNTSREIRYSIAHLYIARCKSLTGAPREAELTKIKEEIKFLKKLNSHSQTRCRYHYVVAEYLQMTGKFKSAIRHVKKSEKLAHKTESPLDLYRAHLCRMQIESQLSSQGFADERLSVALLLAEQYGWANQVRKLRALIPDGETKSIVGTAVSSHVRASSDNTFSGKSVQIATSVENIASSYIQKRQLDAIKRLSLETSKTIVPEEQAQAALDVIIDLLGAERAFLFSLDPQSQGLVVKAGRDSERKDLLELKGYSRSVVDNAFSRKKPIVVTGNDDGDVSLSQSAVMQGLRSIMATPLWVNGELAGVIYIDSSIAKGIFTKDDVEILNALANYISTAMLLSQKARVEIEKQALKKDLELTGFVQSLFLPKARLWESPSLKLAGFYKPALQSGGDWWWFDAKPDGKLTLLLGDVTGHGAGAAMVTAMIASSYRTFNRLNKTGSLKHTIEHLHQTLLETCGKSFQMGILGIEIDPANHTMQAYGGGLPPFLVRAANGTFDLKLVARGVPMGLENFEVKGDQLEFPPGSRLLVFTDGAFEFEAENDRLFGVKNLQRTFEKMDHTQSAEETSTRFAQTIEKIGGGFPFEDDVSFLLVDHLR